MIPELGQLALVLALVAALALGVMPLVGAYRNDAVLMRQAGPAALAQFLFVALAFGFLAASFAANDFSVVNVASNSNSRLPLHYRIAATWGSHEGSILLWTLVMASWTAAVALKSRHLPRVLAARVLGIMGLVNAGLLLFVLFTSNPFLRLLPAAPEGRDLNPLLQDPGMVFHPPILYIGYVGFSVAFAFALAALLGGRLDAAWARWSRPWTTAAWCFLTCGICLGSFWAYYELGWGGWWFWDPVENASFMPWLTGTALIHSLAVTEKRGTFKSWTVLLAIMTFSLSLLGTFLVRSGVITSVHAFATDPARGIFILVFLGLVIGSSLAIFAWRAPRVGLGASFNLVSREAMLLGNNILLVVAMAAVLLGTLYPLVLDIMDAGKISVGPPYFNAVFYPLLAPALFLMGVAPLARWQHAPVPELAARLKWAFAIALIGSIVTPLLLGDWSLLKMSGFLFSFWIVAACATSLVLRLKSAPQRSLIAKLRSNSASYYGMHIAHFGIAAFIFGVTMVKSYEIEKDVRLSIGETVQAGAYKVDFKKLEEVQGPNYDGIAGRFEVTRDGKPVAVMEPEKRFYKATQQTMTEAAIDHSLTRDVYLSLGNMIDDRTWEVRVQIKPFINWIWLGCLIMALGGVFAISDRRYQLRRKTVDELARSRSAPAGSA
jgi:cytochrome c-type biogenesis protein CcmF